LLLVTAVLTSSVALGSVTGVLVVHEIPAPHASISYSTGLPAGVSTGDPAGPATTPSVNLASTSLLGRVTGVTDLAIGSAQAALTATAATSTALTATATSSVALTATAASSVAPVGDSRGSATTGALASGLSVPDAPPVPFIGPVADPNQLVHGSRFLQQISLQPVNKVASYIKSHADDVAALLATPVAPSEVTSWWATLDDSMRNALRSASPGLVGNLDGIPYSIRDLANRTLLSDTMKQLEATIADESGRTVVENAKVQLRMLQSIADALGTQSAASASTLSAASTSTQSAASTGPKRTLLTLDVAGQGKAAIVVGDLNTATYVSYLVPGMFFTIENQMGDWADAASNLYDEELSWLALLDPDAASKSVATVAWIGYHTPNLTNVGGIQNADEGRDALASAIEGLQAIRTGNEPYTSIIAHSYGSTAALMALTEYNFQVDALAMVGSPGSPAKSVSELHVRPGHVWVGEAAWDPIPNSSYFGSDPGSKAYGAKSMGVGGGIDSLTKQVLQASLGHNEYFSAGTESMRNFALIAINQGQYVSAGH
jgi:hypothetical protein